MSTPTAYGMTASLRRQHAADGQPVADVCVRHERGRDGDGKFARVLQLIDGGRVEVVAPDSVWRVSRNKRPLRGGALEQQLRESRPSLIVEEVGWRCGDATELSQNRGHAALFTLSLLQDLLGGLSRAAGRNANRDEISSLHGPGTRSLGPSYR